MRKLILLAGFTLCSFLLHAQNNYAVKVSDSKTEAAIVNAAVKIKSNGKTFKTNESGTVVIQASSDDSLQISAKGYVNREIKLAGQSQAILVLITPQPEKKPVTRKPKRPQ